MSHTFTFTVSITLDRESGKFAARDEMSEVLAEWLEDANGDRLDGLGADGESEYVVISWDIAESASEKVQS